MKTAMGYIIFFCGVSATLCAAETYTLTINGVSNTVVLGEGQAVSLPDGQELIVSLSRDQQSVFTRPLFSFSHDTTLNVNSTLIGEGIHQSLMTTPKGTLILIQEYDQTNPEAFVEVMLKEITKDEELAGYDLKTSAVTKMLMDTEVHGRQSISSLGHQNWVREVYSLSDGESGVLIVTAIETGNNVAEQEIIDAFWASLSITLSVPQTAVTAESGE